MAPTLFRRAVGNAAVVRSRLIQGPAKARPPFSSSSDGVSGVGADVKALVSVTLASLSESSLEGVGSPSLASLASSVIVGTLSSASVASSAELPERPLGRRLSSPSQLSSLSL